ncbi:unnamed protein product [Cyclocybe aegerita]|uniref:Reverse transcriptase domain-containing protein n=1 Tax=Cyclocybe aegerita TaxID=1973307 RepID=A0A8S0Y0B8_CYCAE|nr:unnamed protein product [Cyclocybe aegerita]
MCFSEHELLSALKGCSNSSAPGLDHVTWVHLKELLKDKHILVLFIVLANTCLWVGHWLHIFKESLSVIIPKPNKPSYAVPKAFRPIVLLITFDKLIEKMIANRIQFDAVRHDILHHQLGSICQRSTEDAGLILTHLISSLLSTMKWLFIALVMKLFYIKAAPLNMTLLSFVDDGTILAQSKHLNDNNVGLCKAYKIIYLLFIAFALILEHDKTELFHFLHCHNAYNPALDLGYAPHTGATPLKAKTYWRYLGFYFDRRLMFHEHVCYYATKAFTTVQAMLVLPQFSLVPVKPQAEPQINWD